ncbi:hypothetical protein BU15DRAFT_88401 [Melanogaster broomeanus]|nr:hypothetical protein BU15DRAFT_88401 [Melanogaster broomeanus]
MGVAGLWEVLRPAGQVRSLTELAVTDGFLANPSQQRGFRVGIDASIWFFHAAYGKEGENPELRTLFFRCCRLLQSPLLPLFVFDGPKRPAIKRGKRVGGNTHWLTQGMKNIIEAFGFEWRMAPGEAEAELAYLNMIGVIDAVLSDDVDNFLFGATMVIRNPSSTLSGNRSHPVQNSQGRDDGNHVLTYASSSILSTPSVTLSRAGMILIALPLRRRLHPRRSSRMRSKIRDRARKSRTRRFPRQSCQGTQRCKTGSVLGRMENEVRAELRSNKSGHLPSKKPSLASSLPNDFPSLPVLLSYVDPVTSETEPPSVRKNRHRRVTWRNDPDPMRIAALCELYFEWGVTDVIVRRFRTVLWPGVVCRAVRRGAVDADAQGGAKRRNMKKKTKSVIHHQRNGSPRRSLLSAVPFRPICICAERAVLPLVSRSAHIVLFYAILPKFVSPRIPGIPLPSPPVCPLLPHAPFHRRHSRIPRPRRPHSARSARESGVRGIRPPLVGGLFGIDSDEEGNVEDVGGEDEDEGNGNGDIERLETAAAASKTKKRKPKKAKDEREVPTATLRLWLPACMIRAVAPELVDPYEEKVREKEEKRAKRGTRSAGSARGAGGASKVKSTSGTSRKTKTKYAIDAGHEND